MGDVLPFVLQLGASAIEGLAASADTAQEAEWGIMQYEAQITQLSTFLGRFDEYLGYQTAAFAAQGDQTLRGLQNVLGQQNAAAGYMGLGGTAQAFAQQAGADIETFAGEDRVLGGPGTGDDPNAGLYERGLNQLTEDLLAQQATAQSMIDIYEQGIEIMRDTIESVPTNWGELTDREREQRGEGFQQMTDQQGWGPVREFFWDAFASLLGQD